MPDMHRNPPILVSCIAAHHMRASRTMNIPAFDDRPPDGPQLTAYDERHLVTYLRLLDAAEEGADWREVVKIVFGLDTEREPERARIVHDSHLARARWMTETGYRELLLPRVH
jgi:predicted secreted protein